MITLSLNFGGKSGEASRATQEKEVRKLIDTHLEFPGSDKLKWGLTVDEKGVSSLSFAGPLDVVSEAKRLWKENVGVSSVKEAKAAAGKIATKVKKAVTPAKAKTAKKKIVRASGKVSAPKKAKAKKPVKKAVAKVKKAVAKKKKR